MGASIPARSTSGPPSPRSPLAVVADPRLLALRSELGYTDRLDRAMPDEPEAVTADEQRMLTRERENEHDARLRLQWLAARMQITRALASLDVPAFRRDASDLRAIRRIVDRLDRKHAA